MALVNVAVDLARRGRRVLAVDFDLEAPGLDTFALANRSRASLGLVDFISTYLSSGQAPSAADFMYEEQGLSRHNGEFWIMPSGSLGNQYASQLAHIDWASLYRDHDGYLLLEYLKQQWKTLVNPDYVLIDSRTGHTDVGGICTRQLPQSVVIMFFPNDQNLRGLTKVVRDIRSELTGPRKKRIDLNFVMSNVPDLDDEDRILRDKIRSFQSDLGFDQDLLIVHRYDSLSLLNQVIFTKDRPRSRLAMEYRDVSAAIIRLNPRDRDGSLEYIKTNWEVPPPVRLANRHRNVSLQIPGERERLSKIEQFQEHDQEVMFQLGKYYAHWGQFNRSVEFFDKAIEAGYIEGDVFVERGSILRDFLNQPNRAAEDAKLALKSENLSFGRITRALSLLRPADYQFISNSAAIVGLSFDEKFLVASELNRSSEQARVALDILPSVREDFQEDFSKLGSVESIPYIHTIVLTLMALGKFEFAVELICNSVDDVNSMDIQLTFNYGMALWARGSEVDSRPFSRVLELSRDDSGLIGSSPNHAQCISVAYWATGNSRMALKIADQSRRLIERSEGLEFSCWRYLRVSRHSFLQDIDEIVDLINGNREVIPRFMRDSGL